MDEMLKDPRFAHVAKDPKFRRIPKAERKVKIDHRFEGMFKDKKFTVKYTIDKRGRPLNQSSTEDLRKYYDLSSSEDEDASASSTNERDSDKKEKKEAKGTKKKVNDEEKTMTKIETSPVVKEVLNEEESEAESDESSDDESDEGSLDNSKDIKEEISELDLEENNKQLHKRRKDDGKLTNEVKEKLKDLKVNYARGEGILITDSSSEEESSETSGT